MVCHVSTGDLEGWDAVVGQHCETGEVPRRAESVNVDGLAVIEDVDHLLRVQRELGQQVEGVLGAEVLAGGGTPGLTVEGVHVAQLELDGVGPGLLGEVDEVLGQRDVALVVVADLGDE